MGEHNTNAVDENSRLKFTRNLLDDIEALELMLKNDQIESGVTRIGAEQEFCLVNENWRPAENAVSILESINDDHFTTELATYNLEINLDPLELKGDAFSAMERQLITLMAKAENAAEENRTKIVLAGILPTISTHELKLSFMTPMPRYQALNNMMCSLRGSDFRLNLFGVDELSLKHDSVMFEACNTSFQMHLQINPEDFAESFNWAQTISGPVLGICVNSPMLLGRELWAETRIALFQQSIDTRGVSKALKDQPSRVAFGDGWVTGTIVDLFKNEIARHKVILAQEIEENALEELIEGKTPKLRALALHNGTIYHWNRPCYGVGGGKPHIRIENRYIPSGPTLLDEMANFAFWVGLMEGRPTEFDAIGDLIDFRDAKSNFIKAARYGSESIMSWKGQEVPLKELIINQLLPIARQGLLKMKIDLSDIDRFLSIIKERSESGTAAQWTTGKYRSLKSIMKQDEALVALTESIYQNQINNTPIHNWPNSSHSEQSTTMRSHKVGHIMTTQLYTAYAADTAELTLNIMKWKNINHLPIVDQNETLVGLLTKTHIARFKAKHLNRAEEYKVEDIMVTEVHSVPPSTPIKEAISFMKKEEIGCLPVMQKGSLVGIITIKDVLKFDDE